MSVSLVLLETGQGGRGAPGDSTPMSQLGLSPATSSRRADRGDQHLCRRASSLGQTQQSGIAALGRQRTRPLLSISSPHALASVFMLTLSGSQNGCVTPHVTPPSRGERTGKAGSTFMKKAKASRKISEDLLEFLMVCTVPQG